MKKKVLFVLPYWTRGGAEKQFRYIYEGISEYHDVDILLFNNDDINIPNLRNKFYIANNLFEEKNKIVKVFLRLKSYIRINSFIKKNLPNYDLAIGHNKLLVPVMPMLKSKCTKVIFSARETDDAFSKGFIKKILSNLDMITCNSQSTYKLLVDINKNIKCINNGVEINEHLEYKKITKIMNVGIVANITRRKNVKLVIESLKYIHDDITITIAGKVVDNDYFEEINKYIKQHNLEKQVKFLSYIRDMNEFYNSCDMVVLPSLYEGTSNVILESFSRKKIILLSNIPENTCLVKDEYKNIIVFNPDSAEDLGDKINKISKLVLEANPLIKEILEVDYNIVINEYSIQVLKNKYLELI